MVPFHFRVTRLRDGALSLLDNYLCSYQEVGCVIFTDSKPAYAASCLEGDVGGRSWRTRSASEVGEVDDVGSLQKKKWLCT